MMRDKEKNLALRKYNKDLSGKKRERTAEMMENNHSESSKEDWFKHYL